MFPIKCTSCSLLLGESEIAIENIVCVFCIQERQSFRWIFSGIPQTVSLKEYWNEYEKFFTLGDKNKWSIRRDESLELESFTNQLRFYCDKEIKDE